VRSPTERVRHFLEDMPFQSRLVGVRHDKGPASAVRCAKPGSGQTKPERIIPEGGKVREDRRQTSMDERRRVLNEHDPRSQCTDDSPEFFPEATAWPLNSLWSFNCILRVADIDTRKSAGDQIRSAILGQERGALGS